MRTFVVEIDHVFYGRPPGAVLVVQALNEKAALDRLCRPYPIRIRQGPKSFRVALDSKGNNLLFVVMIDRVCRATPAHLTEVPIVVAAQQVSRRKPRASGRHLAPVASSAVATS